MNILVFNVGSSSIKYSVYEGKKQMLKGNVQKVLNSNDRKNAL